ncbi:hypothetical protein FA15DRAFT_710807 [Coprinopsis marcescibilis]|uniref:Uncharacterized protein n=1 Tax=Coprinopsis marcescibilis TaxID=230819 RepID=A0A5C3KCP3_COPMA|nr:hypothetical protein FA15DRAFT_710807 [Coprinopsis marcescibilis]
MSTTNVAYHNKLWACTNTISKAQEADTMDSQAVETERSTMSGIPRDSTNEPPEGVCTNGEAISAKGGDVDSGSKNSSGNDWQNVFRTSRTMRRATSANVLLNRKQIDRIERCQARLNLVTSENTPGPSKLGKGKGPDPHNWGKLLDDDATNTEIQQLILDTAKQLIQDGYTGEDTNDNPQDKADHVPGPTVTKGTSKKMLSEGKKKKNRKNHEKYRA